MVESRWKLYRIWLCEHHAQLVAKRMRERGQSRDEVLGGLMDSLIGSLGPALGLRTEAAESRTRTRPRTAEEAEEMAAAERLDQEDLDDMEYMARAAANEKCSVCTSLGDRVELRRYEREGETFHLCPRDEKAVLDLVEQGMSWQKATHEVGADLFQAMLDPEITKEVRRRLRGESGE